MRLTLKNLFESYIKEKKESDHATLSASGAERWLGCPGSIRLSEGIPSIDNPAGIRGTNTHTLLQFILENGDWSFLLAVKESEQFKEHIGYDNVMLQNAVFAYKHVLATLERMQHRYEAHPKLMVEKKVELKGVGFGTADVILHHPYGVLHVMDYKNGVKVVESENNLQGLYYAYGAADLFNWEFSEVHITIIQPNTPHKYGHVRTWKTDHETLERAGQALKRGAKLTKQKDAPLVKGDYCFFCPARPICPLHMEQKALKLMEIFNA